MTLTKHAEFRLRERFGLVNHCILCDLIACGEPVHIMPDGTHKRRFTYQGTEIDAVIDYGREKVITFMHPKYYEPLNDAVKEYWR